MSQETGRERRVEGSGAGPTVAYRLSGGGNDFLALAEPRKVPNEETIRAWCTRGLSLGADGLFVLRRAAGCLRMDYFNADGHAADLCLNGTRCAAQLAAHLGWIETPLAIETGAGTIHAEVLDAESVRLHLEPPSKPPEKRTLCVAGTLHDGWFLTVGVPQFVVFWPESLLDAPVVELGAALRRHREFGDAGTNVMFVRCPTPHRLEIRAYERGVETETLACGTGVLAATAAGIAEGALALPLDALTRGGFELTVDGATDENGRISRWSLAGDARLLTRLEIEPGAGRLPPPPTWS